MPKNKKNVRNKRKEVMTLGIKNIWGHPKEGHEHVKENIK